MPMCHSPLLPDPEFFLTIEEGGGQQWGGRGEGKRGGLRVEGGGGEAESCLQGE